MRIGPREALLLGVLVAFPVASYVLAFRPRNAEIDLAKKEIEHKRTMLRQVQEYTAKEQPLELQIAEIQEKIRLIEAKLPSRKEVDAVVRSISDLAVQCGLESPNIESLKPVSAATYMEQPLKVEMVGPFKAGEKGFYPFLAKLEQLPRITRLSDMKLTRTKDREEDGRMKAEFTLSIYFQPEEGSR